MSKTWKEVKDELLNDPSIKNAYDKPDIIHWLSCRLIDFKIWVKSMRNK